MLFTAISCSAQTSHSVNEVTGLQIGENAPLFTAIDSDSTYFSLDSNLKICPVLIIFYRGFWCPVCNKHLSSIQDSLKMIEDLGIKVIAISPEKPEFLDKMAQKTGVQFTLLYDEAYKIAAEYGVLYDPNGFQLFTYNTILGAKLKKTHSDGSQQLPIPATYLINQQGIIIWRQFDPNYHHRSTVKEVLDFFENYPNE